MISTRIQINTYRLDIKIPSLRSTNLTPPLLILPSQLFPYHWLQKCLSLLNKCPDGCRNQKNPPLENNAGDQLYGQFFSYSSVFLYPVFSQSKDQSSSFLQSSQTLNRTTVKQTPPLPIFSITDYQSSHHSVLTAFAHNLMISLIKAARRSTLINRPIFHFSTQPDPYYILGVQKTAPFLDIKKAFYKLASEFHPDKNSSQQAQQKFVIIKQAFETIKMEKGLMKPQNFYTADDRQSMRPNPEKYSTDESENIKNFRDYTVFSQKAGGSEEYMTFNSSFKTIKDINEIKIKVEEGEMPDPISRFNLDQYKGRISSYSESGNKYFFVIMTGLTIFTILANQLFNEKQAETKEGALKKLTQVQKRKTIEADLAENRKVDIRNIENSREIRQFKNRQVLSDILSGRSHNLLKDKVISPEHIERV